MDSFKSLNDYYEALQRLKAGKSRIIPKRARITNDAVSLEAGKSKGSIKRSRDVYADLIKSIKEAAEEQKNPEREQKLKLEKAKNSEKQYRDELDAALAREVSLLKELYEIKKKLAKLDGSNILPIRGNSEGLNDDRR